MVSDGEFYQRQLKAEKMLCAFEGGKSVADIIRNMLEAAGYDGLVNGDGECGCGLGDLFPCTCNENLTGCEPAYEFECYRCVKYSENGGDCCKASVDYDVLYSTNAERCEPSYMRDEGLA